MLILVINSGSSSIKYSLIDMNNEKCFSKGIVEGIGMNKSRIRYLKIDGERHEEDIVIKNHEQAIQILIKTLTHPEQGILSNIEKISALGHRVVHGGETLYKPMIINDDVLRMIESNISLAPLHMPPIINSINIFNKVLPDKPMVAVFDTAFHQTIPEKAFLYAIPYEYYKKYGIRRYGFHGTSHQYVSIKASQLMNRPLNTLKMITCHLGNGSSISAVDKGKSLDTSMGFTPLAGVPMGTRSGDIDSAIIGYIMDHEGLTYDETETILNKKSGFLGLSGTTNDCRELERLIENGDKRAKLTVDVFCYNIKKYIGAYTAAMNGVDCIVFTGGIGENSKLIRSEICKGLDYLELYINEDKNKNANSDAIISTDGSKVKILRVNTDEELMIAQDTMRLVNESIDNRIEMQGTAG